MDGSKVGKNSALVSKTDAGSLLVQRVARLRAASVPAINFIFQQVHSPRFHAYVDRINTSSGIPHISAKQINECLIQSTEEEEQDGRDQVRADEEEEEGPHEVGKTSRCPSTDPSW